MATIFIRSLIVYFLIAFALRVMGKRQLGEMQPSELAVTILISNIATLPMEDTSIPFLSGIIPIVSLAAFEVIMSYCTLKNKTFRKIIIGSPVVIIKNGKIDQEKLKELRINADDLLTQLRCKEVFDISEVEFAAIETTGELSVYKKYISREVTAGMLEIPDKPAENDPQIAIISDGAIIEDGLALCNKKREWLDGVLKKENESVKDVLLMTCNKSANYVIIKNELKKGNGK